MQPFASWVFQQKHERVLECLVLCVHDLFQQEYERVVEYLALRVHTAVKKQRLDCVRLLLIFSWPQVVSLRPRRHIVSLALLLLPVCALARLNREQRIRGCIKEEEKM